MLCSDGLTVIAGNVCFPVWWHWSVTDYRNFISPLCYCGPILSSLLHFSFSLEVNWRLFSCFYCFRCFFLKVQMVNSSTLNLKTCCHPHNLAIWNLLVCSGLMTLAYDEVCMHVYMQLPSKTSIAMLTNDEGFCKQWKHWHQPNPSKPWRVLTDPVDRAVADLRLPVILPSTDDDISAGLRQGKPEVRGRRAPAVVVWRWGGRVLSSVGDGEGGVGKTEGWRNRCGIQGKAQTWDRLYLFIKHGLFCPRVKTEIHQRSDVSIKWNQK